MPVPSRARARRQRHRPSAPATSAPGPAAGAPPGLQEWALAAPCMLHWAQSGGSSSACAPADRPFPACVYGEKMPRKGVRHLALMHERGRRGKLHLAHDQLRHVRQDRGGLRVEAGARRRVRHAQHAHAVAAAGHQRRAGVEADRVRHHGVERHPARVRTSASARRRRGGRARHGRPMQGLHNPAILCGFPSLLERASGLVCTSSHPPAPSARPRTGGSLGRQHTLLNPTRRRGPHRASTSASPTMSTSGCGDSSE